MPIYDAIVIGSGPNGLAAAIELARNDRKVLVVEGASTIGGGTRTTALTLPGFKHDYCSAVHPMGALSPFFRQLPLGNFGLEWIYPKASVAHPLDDEPAVLLYKSLEKTAEGLDVDQKNWTNTFQYFIENGPELLEDSLKPLGIPNHPLLLARFGMNAMFPSTLYARYKFKGHRARALFAGCAGHSVLPLNFSFTSALGLMFAVTGHLVDWPIAKGGSTKITEALASYFKQLGGEIHTNFIVNSLSELPDAKAYLFDTDPRQLAAIAGDALPNGYKNRLMRYNYGPGTFKLDWALDGPIPWRDQRCLLASTVHVGGRLQEIAVSEQMAWDGKHCDKPYLILCQQSQFDSSRAPHGKHTGYAYCHVPNGSTVDMTNVIERQIERFAPGFRDLILGRHKTFPRDFQQYNPNYFGGAITGGAANFSQLFTRPIARFNPYKTPNAKLFLCSASTPPGGGVHGMCGYWAAQTVLENDIT